MSTNIKLTKAEVETIVSHVKPLLDGTVAHLDKLPTHPSGETANYIRSQRRYLKQVIGTLKWVIATAKQRG